MNAVSVRDISVQFGGVQALSNVSFDVNAGERLAIIGPNGAGKSTLLNVIGGQIKPTSGRVSLFGADVTDVLPDRRAEVGLARTFQTTSLFSGLTVQTNVALAAHAGTARYPASTDFLRWPDRTLRRVKELLEDWTFIHHGETRVGDRSYGEQRTLETMMALARRPRILLFDEPSAGMSAVETNKMIDSIERIDPDVAVIVIEHDLDVVRRIATRVIVLQTGRVVADGPPDEIASNPLVREIYWFEDEARV